MNAKEINEVFAKRLKYYLDKYDMSQAELARRLGVGTATVSNWTTAQKTPRMDKLDTMCKMFHCKRSDLLELPSEKNEEYTQCVRIPVLGKVAAGIPIEAVENIVDYVEIPTDWDGDYGCLEIKGDSMSPRIQNGDRVIVRKQADAESGDIVVAMIDGQEATVKKLIKNDNGIVLQPYNPAYEPMYFTYRDVMEKPVNIWGKVVELRAKL